MRRAARSLIVAILALLSAFLIGFASTITSAITLSVTALIVPGTGTHNVNTAIGYKENARDYYLTTTPCVGSGCTLQGIDYPATFWPFGFPPFPSSWCPGLSCDRWNVSVGTGVANLDTALKTQLANRNPTVIFGYSQGAAVVSNELRTLANLPQDQKNLLSAVVIGNIDRPSGGLWTRFGFLGHIPILDATLGLPTPNNIGITTTDIAFQYDGVADFPLYPINLLADLNAIAGFQYIHGTYLDPNQNSMFTGLPDGYTPQELADQMNPALHPENFRYFGNTTYITIPTRNLPIVQPLRDFIPVLGNPIADLISPSLRVLIDTGYDRSINPGVYTPARLIPIIDPVKLAVDLAASIPAGIAAALNDLGKTSILPFDPPAPLAPTTPATTPLTPTSPLSLATTRSTPTTPSTFKLAAKTDPTSTTANTDETTTKPDPTKPDPTKPATSAATKPDKPKKSGPERNKLTQPASPATGSAEDPSKPITTTTTGRPITTGTTTTSAGTGSSTGAGASSGTSSSRAAA
jgi:hypothetical protein